MILPLLRCVFEMLSAMSYYAITAADVIIAITPPPRFSSAFLREPLRYYAAASPQMITSLSYATLIRH